MISERRHDRYAARRLAEFAARCRQHGLAITPQRLAIIQALLASAEHPRADAIHAEIRKQHPYMSLATVHRTLETLCEIGEARKVTMLHDSARYDGNLTPHHHVVCVKCRRIRDIEIPELRSLLEGRSELGEFKLLGSSLEIQALCARCNPGRARGRDTGPRKATAGLIPNNQLHTGDRNAQSKRNQDSSESEGSVRGREPG